MQGKSAARAAGRRAKSGVGRAASGLLGAAVRPSAAPPGRSLRVVSPQVPFTVEDGVGDGGNHGCYLAFSTHGT